MQENRINGRKDKTDTFQNVIYLSIDSNSNKTNSNICDPLFTMDNINNIESAS